MDGERFDAVATAVGRRGALRLLLGGGLAAVLAGLGGGEAAARHWHGVRVESTNTNTAVASVGVNVDNAAVGVDAGNGDVTVTVGGLVTLTVDVDG